MAVRHGYGKIAGTDALVFAYDTGDTANSFKGKPATNILAGIIRNYNGAGQNTYLNGKLLRYNGYTETVNIPTLGQRTVESVEIYNVYSSYGGDGNYECCPSLFNYSNGWLNTPLQGSTLYTYQIIYKCNSGYTNANYMYHYEYDVNGSYITEFGVHTTGQRVELGDGWYMAWATFTTQAATAKGYFGLWYYQYNVEDKVSVAAISVHEGAYVMPAKQILPGSTTRSATQGLLDLTGNYSLDLSNVSFSSTAQVTFDGSNDYIDILNSTSLFSGTQDLTVEAAYNMQGQGGGEIFGNYGSGYTTNHLWFSGQYGIWLDGGVYAPGYPLANGKYHMVGTRENGVMKLYLNGVLVNSGTRSNSIATDINYRIGADVNGAGEPFTGDIYVVKAYSRALTADEVRNNYNHYKTRFNLP